MPGITGTTRTRTLGDWTGWRGSGTHSWQKCGPSPACRFPPVPPWRPGNPWVSTSAFYTMGSMPSG
eukprot:696855-Lingulodinium_polyedra.AAC.1